MNEPLHPRPTNDVAERRRALAPDAEAAFHAFSRAVFRDGALPRRTKELIAVAVAHVTQCPYCIRGHTRAAARHGASAAEIMEAIWVASEMRAGAAFAHSAIALEALGDAGARSGPDPIRSAGAGAPDRAEGGGAVAPPPPR